MKRSKLSLYPGAQLGGFSLPAFFFLIGGIAAAFSFIEAFDFTDDLKEMATAVCQNVFNARGHLRIAGTGYEIGPEEAAAVVIEYANREGSLPATQGPWAVVAGRNFQ